jgi:hypothetical protein
VTTVLMLLYNRFFIGFSPSMVYFWLKPGADVELVFPALKGGAIQKQIYA